MKNLNYVCLVVLLLLFSAGCSENKTESVVRPAPTDGVDGQKPNGKYTESTAWAATQYEQYELHEVLNSHESFYNSACNNLPLTNLVDPDLAPQMKWISLKLKTTSAQNSSLEKQSTYTGQQTKDDRGTLQLNFTDTVGTYVQSFFKGNIFASDAKTFERWVKLSTSGSSLAISESDNELKNYTPEFLGYLNTTGEKCNLEKADPFTIKKLSFGADTLGGVAISAYQVQKEQRGEALCAIGSEKPQKFKFIYTVTANYSFHMVGTSLLDYCSGTLYSQVSQLMDSKTKKVYLKNEYRLKSGPVRKPKVAGEI